MNATPTFSGGGEAASLFTYTLSAQVYVNSPLRELLPSQ